ncbi:hypothetical protein PIB30_098835 [Stylosanthes scabra]|uniref:RING-type domain-containing protein n=1 Tax=Stylosanthes scabra TaxID=79078 RepID=A0ABU6VVE4_9FABA|nr:hypothetical protein [Stylosanthes scabra]
MSALLTNDLNDLSINPQIQSETGLECEGEIRGVEGGGGNHVHREGLCAICLDNIPLQDTALVKGCEHAYCVTCILRWATYRERVTCPHIQDYMFEESVCLLLRASWFQPLKVEKHVEHEDAFDLVEEFYPYQYDYEYDEEEDDDDLDEVYYGSSSSLRIGNRRWGDNGYVRSGRLEARPVPRSNFHDSGGASSSSREPKKKEVAEKVMTGRRAKRALKREAADKAAAAKHQQHLVRLGRK